MGKEIPIVYVMNATNKQRDTEATYHVQMADASIASAIRKRFSGYFTGGKSLRPPSLSKISISME